MKRTSTRWRRGALPVLVALAAMSVGACGGSSDEGSSGSSGGAPARLEILTRAAAEGSLRPLAEAYSRTHRTQVELNVVPDDQFVTRFSSAAGARELPDLVAVDVVYMPRFVEAGLFTDLTARIEGLPFRDQLLPAHVRLASREERTYGVPAAVDVSSLFWNKRLFRRAGLDPDEAPSSWEEIERAADRVSRLGGRTRGFWFAGNCTGCNAFTFLPLVWAAGGTVLEGDRATIDTPQMRGALDLYRRMWEGDDVPRTARSESGPNWASTFAGGQVGIAPLGSFAIAQFKQDHPDLDFGVAPLPGRDGGRSAFAGGDILGIPAGSENEQAAWDFIEWMLSEEVQVENVAKRGALTVRQDLADNRYSRRDERVLVSNELIDVAQTPVAVPYNELFNDAQGPFLATLRRAVLQGDVDGAVREGQGRFEQILAGASE